MSKDFYTTHEVSKFCDVYPTTVINWIKEGMLPAYTTAGGHRRIKRDDLLNLMKKNNMPIPDELLKGDKFRVLVIDDDARILKMIKTVLSSEEQFDIETATSGFQAGLLISKWLPDVILLDMLMPEMDGFEVCRQLRTDEKTKDIPVIAITVLKGPKEIKKMFSSGITDYVTKPFKADELLKKVKTHILAEKGP